MCSCASTGLARSLRLSVTRSHRFSARWRRSSYCSKSHAARCSSPRHTRSHRLGSVLIQRSALRPRIFLQTHRSTDLSLYSSFLKPHRVAVSGIHSQSLYSSQPAEVCSSTSFSDRPCHSASGRPRSSNILNLRNFHTTNVSRLAFRKIRQHMTLDTH